MAARKTNGKTPRSFYARLPAPTYRRLRRIAKMPPVDIDTGPQALFVRLPPDAHAKLRRMALTTPGDAGVVASMCYALRGLILAPGAAKVKVSGRRCMASVCTALIRNSKAPRARR